MPRQFVRRFYNARLKTVTFTAYEEYVGDQKERPFFSFLRDGVYVVPVKNNYITLIKSVYCLGPTPHETIDETVWSIQLHEDLGQKDVDEWKEVA